MASKPDYIAYAVEGEKDDVQWTRIGAAWTTKGDGVSILLRALPINGRIVLRVPKDEDDSPRDNRQSSPDTRRTR